MNTFDLAIAILVLGLAAVGFRRGLLASALPLAGFVAGATLGSRIGQALLTEGSQSAYAPLVGVLSGIFVGSMLAVALDGVAGVLRARLQRGAGLTALDDAGGAVLLGALGLALAWALGAIALHTPGPESRQLRESAQRSVVLSALNGVLPPSGPVLNVLRRVDPRPAVPGPQARVGPPDRGLLADPDVERAAASTVRVLGTACGLGVGGSGWVAGPELVVTNAHVVAGQSDTTVAPPEQGELEAEVVHYEPRQDLAILRVPGLTAPPLEFGPPAPGRPGAVIGFPENGPLTLTAARLGSTQRVVSQDSYGRGPVRRQVTPFRGEVRSGNSGGPLVDEEGGVIATVFAATTSAGPPSGLGVPNRVVRDALEGSLEATETGPCAA